MVSKIAPTHSAADIAAKKALGQNGPQLGSAPKQKPKAPITALITQKQSLLTSQNKSFFEKSPLLLAASLPTSDDLKAKPISTKIIRQDLAPFLQREFIAKDGAKLDYNLFIPSTKPKALMLFMHDAGAVSKDVLTTLTQGLGAIAWSKEGVQKHLPLLVLAVQYPRVIVDDNYAHTDDLARTIELINALKDEFKVDRVYASGQSMGGMAALDMSMEYEGFFAGAFIVASKWEFSRAAKLSKQRLVLVVSEKDEGAKPSMDELVGILSSLGKNICQARLDASDSNLNAKTQKLILAKKDYDVWYFVFKDGDHRYTWQHAYDMNAAMLWLLGI